MRRRLRTLAIVVASLASVTASSVAEAQTFPSKPVRLIIGFPPGGITDLIARVLAQGLQERFGHTVLVENRPGGNFVIAADATAKAAPDGHTLFMALDSTFTITPETVKNLPFDAERDFAPITLTAVQTPFIVGSTKAPAKTMRELLAYAKANPGKISWGSSALSTQLIGEQLRLASGTTMQYVPFKGSPPMLQALLSGDLDYAVTTFTPYLAYAKEGKLVSLAVTGPKRESIAADVPALAELGFPEATAYIWYGLFAPAQTPRDVLARIQTETARVLGDAAVKQKFVEAGIEPATSTPAELAARIREERAKWAAVIKAAGLKF